MSYSHFSPDGNYVKPTHTFEEIQVCPHCHADAKNLGEDGITFCSEDCGCIEFEGSLTMYVCNRCGEVKDTEECTCK